MAASSPRRPDTGRTPTGAASVAPEAGPDPLVWAATVLLCLPGLVAVATAVRAGWVPTSDSATILTRAYDVLTPRSPLVGQYSLVSPDSDTATHSLGPLLYWALALPARFGPPVAPAVVMAALNTAALVGSARLAFRHGGRAFGVAASVGLLVLARSLGLSLFTSVWNPAAAVLPFAALVWVSWAVMVGRHRLLPLVAALASLVAQCHLTYLLPALMLSGAALVAVVVDARRDRLEQSPLRLLGATAVVLAVAWSAPLLDQLSGPDGNLGRVATAGGGSDQLGPGVGVDMVVRTVAGPPPWLRSGGTTQLSPGEVLSTPAPLARVVAVVVLAALVAVTVGAWRRRDRPVLALGATALGLLAAVAVVTAIVPAERAIVVGYSLWWASVVGVMVWLALGWGLARAWAPARALPRAGAADRPVARPVLAVVAAGALVLVATTTGSDSIAWSYEPATALGDAAVAATEPGGRYEVNAVDFGTVMPAALAYRLRRAGRDPVVPGPVGSATGDAYTARGEPCDGILSVVPVGGDASGGEVLVVVDVEPPDRPAGAWQLVLTDDEASSC